MSPIYDVHARTILDSRGNPTVEVEVVLESGARGRAAVPSGASTGQFEAVELQDADPSAWLGKGVSQAVENVITEIAQGIRGLDPADQAGVDSALVLLDGTDNKGRLGANAILGVSLAVAKAAAAEAGVPLYNWIGGPEAHLPVPMLNVVNGGVHADNSLDLQEFMIVPGGAETFSEALIAVETFHTLKKLLEERGLRPPWGTKAASRRTSESSEVAIDAILQAVERAGHRERIAIALDPAMSSSSATTGSTGSRPGGDTRAADGLLGRARRALSDRLDRGRRGRGGLDGVEGADRAARRSRPARRRRPLRHERGTAAARNRGGRRQLDPCQGQPDRDADRIARGDRLARSAGYDGDLAPLRRDRGHDDADLAVANAGQIKTGAPSRTDRTAKYNQLLRIEGELGADAEYPGWDAFKTRP